MRQLVFRFLIIAGLMVCAPLHHAVAKGLSAGDLAAQAHGEDAGAVASIRGVRPPDIAGLEPSTAYNGLCLWRCMVFLGPKPRARRPSFPAIVVHQPFPVDADTLLDAFISAKNASRSDWVSVEGQRQYAQEGARRVAVQMIRTNDKGKKGGQPSILTALEQDGASVVVQLYATFDKDLALRQDAYTRFIAQIGFDGAAVAAGERRRDQAVAEAAEQVGNAFKAGEKVQIYTRLVLTPGPTGGGVAGIPTVGMRTERKTLVLLPGGVALEEAPDGPLNPIDLTGFFGTEAPTRWAPRGGTIVLTRGDGSSETLRASEGARKLHLPDDEFPWNRVPNISPADFVGEYRYSYITAFQGGAGATQTTTGAAGDSTLRLAADRRYTLNMVRTGSALGRSTTASSTRRINETGAWSFDPASHSMTFKPDNGAAYAFLATKRAENECVDGVCRWMIAGQIWKRK